MSKSQCRYVEKTFAQNTIGNKRECEKGRNHFLLIENKSKANTAVEP